MPRKRSLRLSKDSIYWEDSSSPTAGRRPTPQRAAGSLAAASAHAIETLKVALPFPNFGVLRRMEAAIMDFRGLVLNVKKRLAFCFLSIRFLVSFPDDGVEVTWK